MRQKEIEFPQFYSAECIKDKYIYTSQGHWFNPDTMRFFGTRLTSGFKKIDDQNYLFITSDKDFQGKRKRSVRHLKMTVNPNKFCGYDMAINTVKGYFNVNVYQAEKALKELTAKGLQDV